MGISRPVPPMARPRPLELAQAGCLGPLSSARPDVRPSGGSAASASGRLVLTASGAGTGRTARPFPPSDAPPSGARPAPASGSSNFGFLKQGQPHKDGARLKLTLDPA
jgi:hypothetical protein